MVPYMWALLGGVVFFASSPLKADPEPHVTFSQTLVYNKKSSKEVKSGYIRYFINEKGSLFYQIAIDFKKGNREDFYDVRLLNVAPNRVLSSYYDEMDKEIKILGYRGRITFINDRYAVAIGTYPRHGTWVRAIIDRRSLFLKIIRLDVVVDSKRIVSENPFLEDAIEDEDDGTLRMTFEALQ